jgi:hypothetical protein
MDKFLEQMSNIHDMKYWKGAVKKILGLKYKLMIEQMFE